MKTKLLLLLILAFVLGSSATPAMVQSSGPQLALSQPVIEQGDNPIQGEILKDPDVMVVTNTSGRFLQVIHGNTGANMFIGNVRWRIAPGETFYSYSWGPGHYVYFDGRRYHFIGAVWTLDTFNFFLVEDWTY